MTESTPPSAPSRLGASLSLPASAVAYAIGEAFSAGRTMPVIEFAANSADLEGYAAAGHCEIEVGDDPYAEVLVSWRKPGRLTSDLQNGAVRVRWQGHTLELLVATWHASYHQERRWWVAAPSRAVAESFVDAVSTWSTEVRGEVLVFADGCWRKDAELRRAIRGTTLDDVVLAGTLKEELHADLVRFCGSREVYERLRIPWKRGVLLLGPPGNGKTQTIKALVNALDLPCLYVRSIAPQHGETSHVHVRSVFQRARHNAPCVLVLEDLDSLVDDHNRSFFLNELDGFSANEGILTIASTNHPERLDPAIVDRPSRFDRKYHFLLPGPTERAKWLELWNRGVAPELRFDDEAVARLAGLTEGFSFAYLKELAISAMMLWVDERGARRMVDVASALVEPLRAQMVTTVERVTAPRPRGLPRGFVMTRIATGDGEEDE